MGELLSWVLSFKMGTILEMAKRKIDLSDVLCELRFHSNGIAFEEDRPSSPKRPLLEFDNTEDQL